MLGAARVMFVWQMRKPKHKLAENLQFSVQGQAFHLTFNASSIFFTKTVIMRNSLQKLVASNVLILLWKVSCFNRVGKGSETFFKHMGREIILWTRLIPLNSDVVYPTSELLFGRNISWNLYVPITSFVLNTLWVHSQCHHDSILQTRQLEFRAVKKLIQGHPGSMHWSWKLIFLIAKDTVQITVWVLDFQAGQTTGCSSWSFSFYRRKTWNQESLSHLSY